MRVHIRYARMIVFAQPLRFQWDTGNQTKSWVKHRVTSDEAEQAFADEQRAVGQDPRPYSGEQRLYLLGKTRTGRLLYIAFTIRGKAIRVISARDVNRREVPLYEKAA